MASPRHIVGISTGCFHRRSIFDCLESIRRAGFLMLEVCSSPSHLDYHNLEDVRRASSLMSTQGMEAYLFHAPFSQNTELYRF
jgi:hypothetical protein